jgi:hypothetical protein
MTRQYFFNFLQPVIATWRTCEHVTPEQPVRHYSDVRTTVYLREKYKFYYDHLFVVCRKKSWQPRQIFI